MELPEGDIWHVTSLFLNKSLKKFQFKIKKDIQI